jgi:type II secretory pathway component PulC
MNTRKALFTSKLALVIVLGYVVAKAVLPSGDTDNHLAPVSAHGKGRAQAIEPTHLPDLSLKDYTQIATRNPFGTSTPAKGSEQGSFTDDSFRLARSVSEELGLALFGTISGSPSVARAIIKDLKTGVCDIYKVGQVVGNACIEGIEANAVILFQDDEKKILDITTWRFNNSDNNHAYLSQTNNGSNKVQETDLSAEKSGTNIRTKSEHVEEILKSAVIEPYVVNVNGQTNGLRITGLEEAGIAGDLGFKNGDVIREVNGQQLTSKQKAFQILKKARSQATINFEILRNNEIEKLVFDTR